LALKIMLISYIGKGGIALCVIAAHRLPCSMAKRPREPDVEKAYRGALRDMRTAAGLRQEDLAAALRREQSWWSRVERGVRRLDVLELRDVCHLCGTTVADFIEALEQRIAGS
jgi:hypothetical protein